MAQLLSRHSFLQSSRVFSTLQGFWCRFPLSWRGQGGEARFISDSDVQPALLGEHTQHSP